LSPAEVGFSLQPLSGTVGQDGAFRIVGVPPGRFALSVDAMPENAYIKAIVLDNAANYGTLDFSRGVRGPRLKATISLNGAQVSGEVRPSDGGVLPSVGTMVFLASEPNLMAPARSAAPVVKGQYTLKGVPPGKYKIYAADMNHITVANRPAYLAAAETLEVVEGGRVTKNLKVVAPEETNAKQ
jgi:hypothetical protein